MTRIDIAEVTHFSQQLRASNQELKQYVNAVKQAVIAYINDTSISGDAIASSKEYYAGAYFPLCASIKQALDLSERKMQKYITDFHSQVDSSPNSRLDVDGIHDLNQKITGFENRLESVTSQLTALNGTGHASELNYLATQIFEAHKKEEILNKFMDFEQSHGNFFYEVGELAHYIKQALDNIQQNLKFDGKTGMYHLEKLNPSTFSKLTKMYASQQEIDDKIREIEEIGLTPNVPKGNSAGFITIDGKMSTEATLDFVNQQMIYWQSEAVFREVLGVGSFYRAVYGVDAVSGKHISDGQRLLDGALVLTQYGAPVLGLAKFTSKFGIKNTAPSFGFAETGARNISAEQFFREEALAEEMYANFRAMGKQDIKSISSNTGVPEWRVERIKDHVFNNLHIKDSGVARFDPDFEIAQAWERLRLGTFKKSDLQLLDHEIFEAKFESIFNTDYRTAHNKTIESGRPWDFE